MLSATVSSSDVVRGGERGAELRILLVEDSVPTRMRLAELLTEPGVMRVVATADTQSQACCQLDTQPFDALVVDIELREGSGIAVVRHARKPLAVSLQPLILVLTNFVQPAVRERCIAAGADVFLDKTWQFDRLRALILRGRDSGGH